jgi:hypothetical protein
MPLRRAGTVPNTALCAAPALQRTASQELRAALRPGHGGDDIGVYPDTIFLIRCDRLSRSNGLVIISMPGCKKPLAMATFSA